MATVIFTQTTHADAIKALKDFNRAQAKIAELEQAKDAAKAVIIAAMGGADEAKATVGVTAFTIRNKAVTSTRLDTKRLKAEKPEIAKAYSSTSTSPRFTVALK